MSITPDTPDWSARGGFKHGSILNGNLCPYRVTSQWKSTPSVGSVDDSYDNALAETINGLYKAEVIWRQRSWPGASAVEMATLNWVEWFNNHRLFGPIGYIPPAEAEANYYAAVETLDMVASLKPNSLQETRGCSQPKNHQYLIATT
jgi:hypothetical protein